MKKPLRPCCEFHCYNLTRERYCEEHRYKEKETQQDKNRYYDRFKRDKESTAFYRSKAWERLREQALMRDKGLCLQCKNNRKIKVADMVDHIIPIKVDPSVKLKLENLQSLCNPCHNRKTAEDKKKYG
ncbi:HNH endonuclease [Bacillus anthracis]|uniref:HNH endonuclease n=1 Tax=Bacillus anthracis TaxID=1392 RepID=UPI000BF59590|nr:HNH endonuclease [Bacillus anthracis]PGB51835.1 HNH endonuclease [Bacillus anthracis]